MRIEFVERLYKFGKEPKGQGRLFKLEMNKVIRLIRQLIF